MEYIDITRNPKKRKQIKRSMSALPQQVNGVHPPAQKLMANYIAGVDENNLQQSFIRILSNSAYLAEEPEF